MVLDIKFIVLVVIFIIWLHLLDSKVKIFKDVFQYKLYQ